MSLEAAIVLFFTFLFFTFLYLFLQKHCQIATKLSIKIYVVIKEQEQPKETFTSQYESMLAA